MSCMNVTLYMVYCSDRALDNMEIEKAFMSQIANQQVLW